MRQLSDIEYHFKDLSQDELDNGFHYAFNYRAAISSALDDGTYFSKQMAFFGNGSIWDVYVIVENCTLTFIEKLDDDGEFLVMDRNVSARTDLEYFIYDLVRILDKPRLEKILNANRDSLPTSFLMRIPDDEDRGYEECLIYRAPAGDDGEGTNLRDTRFQVFPPGETGYYPVTRKMAEKIENGDPQEYISYLDEMGF